MSGRQWVLNKCLFPSLADSRQKQRTAESARQWRQQGEKRVEKAERLLGIPQVLNECVYLDLEESREARKTKRGQRRQGRKRV